jgi:aryl-alcohol dehydrogenase-like predicted oxidoreductase
MFASTSSAPGTITIGGELTVGRIGFGAMRLTGDQVWREYPDHDGGIALLRHVVDSGVTFIDTADVYGPHANEELIREALHPYPDELVIAIGLSNVTVAQFEAAREMVEIAALTAAYGLGNRLGAAHLAAAERTGIVFSPWGPTRFDGPDEARIRAVVGGIAGRYGASAQQVALAWQLQRSPHSIPIPGTTSIAHFEANLAAGRLRLSAEEVQQLTDLTPDV